MQRQPYSASSVSNCAVQHGGLQGQPMGPMKVRQARWRQSAVPAYFYRSYCCTCAWRKYLMTSVRASAQRMVEPTISTTCSRSVAQEGLSRFSYTRMLVPVSRFSSLRKRHAKLLDCRSKCRHTILAQHKRKPTLAVALAYMDRWARSLMGACVKGARARVRTSLNWGLANACGDHIEEPQWRMIHATPLHNCTTWHIASLQQYRAGQSTPQQYIVLSSTAGHHAIAQCRVCTGSRIEQGTCPTANAASVSHGQVVRSGRISKGSYVTLSTVD